MNNPLDKVYLDEAMLDVVAGGGSVSSGSDTYTADENTIYMVPDEIGDLVQTTGTSSSDVMSQKAVTDALADKVDKTTSANKVYATDNSGNQTTLSIGTANGNATIYRDSSSGSSMPDGYLVSHDPSNSYHVATKKYADERVTANPSGTGSTDLTKISIGGTVYNIPSGGGGSYLHTLTFNDTGIYTCCLVTNSSTPITLANYGTELAKLIKPGGFGTIMAYSSGDTGYCIYLLVATPVAKQFIRIPTIGALTGTATTITAISDTVTEL